MLKIGLTGGIGSGKSTIAELFNTLFRIPIIDADIISRQLVEPGQPALALIQKYFGKSVINPEGALDRNRLKEIIFSDQTKKKQLEGILHPLIYEEMQSIVDRQTSPYSILCIPLLMETKMCAFVDRILVVDCSAEVQIERVMRRDNLSKKRMMSILSSQVSSQHRLAHANDVIDNTKTTNQLAEQVKTLHNQYLYLTRSNIAT
ncbi:MAG: dephospho-CoA kinase [Methylococcales bacterium]|nr:dephospho-CoA kinase [Methylococcales bacterium]